MLLNWIFFRESFIEGETWRFVQREQLSLDRRSFIIVSAYAPTDWSPDIALARDDA